MFVSAPWYSPAIRLASVSPVPNSDDGIWLMAPITCVTAIASPSARPRPRMTRRGQAGPCGLEDDAPDDLPARRPERARRVLEIARGR